MGATLQINKLHIKLLIKLYTKIHTKPTSDKSPRLRLQEISHRHDEVDE